MLMSPHADGEKMRLLLLEPVDSSKPAGVCVYLHVHICICDVYLVGKKAHSIEETLREHTQTPF